MNYYFKAKQNRHFGIGLPYKLGNGEHGGGINLDSKKIKNEESFESFKILNDFPSLGVLGCWVVR